MKRLVALMLASGLLLAGCREQRAADRRPDRERTELASEPMDVRPANSFRHSVQAVLADADRQIDQLARMVRGRWNAPAELERRLKDVRRRHAALRRDAQQLERGRRTPDSASQAEMRRRLSNLQHALELARLKAIRTRYEFESEMHSYAEGLEAQIERLDRQVRAASCPVRFGDRWRVARLMNRHERLEQRLAVLQVAGRGGFGNVRRRVTEEAAGLQADVRQLANEIDCVVGTGRRVMRHGG